MGKFLTALFFIFIYANASATTSVAAGFLKVTPGKMTGFDSYPKEKAKVIKSFEVIEAVINSEEFKDKVLHYNNTTPEGFGYTANKSMSNSQIYEFLMSGQELIDGQRTLGEMNFDMQRYWSSWFTRKVIGYTNMGSSQTIFMNGRKYQYFEVANIASNLTHEWIHLMGFSHANAKDHDSVPYAVGYILEDLAQKYLKQGFLD